MIVSSKKIGLGWKLEISYILSSLGMLYVCQAHKYGRFSILCLHAHESFECLLFHDLNYQIEPNHT